MIQPSFLPKIMLAIVLSAGSLAIAHPAFAQPIHATPASAASVQVAQAKQSGEPPASADEPAQEGSDEVVPSADDIDVSTVDPVSDEELSQFADVLLSLQTLQDSYREQALSAVQSEGLSPERFDQILVMLRSPQSPETEEIPEVTPEESGQFERAMAQIGAIQESIQGQMRQAILSEGLELARFQEIAAVVNSDQALEERVRQIMEDIVPSQG